MDGIDTAFDFRTDTPVGKDPDSHSPTLRRYHKLLWSKPLPGGAMFDLDDETPDTYLHHKSALGEFWLSSDSVIATFTHRALMQPIISQFTAAEVEEFEAIGSTIGAMMVFPSNAVSVDWVGRKLTINGARGFRREIADRMDLTLECIRRHYIGLPSPLENVLARYSDFFVLFVDFEGYVRFFLLDDLVTDDCASVRFFLPSADFTTPAVPQDGATYQRFRQGSMQFVRDRNARIAARPSARC